MNSDSLWLSDNFVYIIMFLASFLTGLGYGFGLPAAGSYISNCAIESNKGFYFSFYLAF